MAGTQCCVLWVSFLPLVLAVVALALTVPKYMAGRFDLKRQGALATRAHFLLKPIPGAIRNLTSGRCQMFISRSWVCCCGLNAPEMNAVAHRFMFMEEVSRSSGRFDLWRRLERWVLRHRLRKNLA